MRARVDALLCEHVVIRAPIADRAAGAYFYTLRDPETGQRVDEPGYGLPMFAFYRDSCDTVYKPPPMDREEVIERQLRSGQAREVLERQYQIRRYNHRLLGRATVWCLKAVSAVTLLDLVGNLSSELVVRLGRRMIRLNAIRYPKNINYDHEVPALWATHVVVLIDLTGGSASTPRLPQLVEGTTTLTMVMKFPLDDEVEYFDLSEFAKNIPASLSAVNVILSRCWGKEETIEPGGPVFGFLYDFFEAIIPTLDSLRLSIVGLTASVAPFLDLAVPSTNAVVPASSHAAPVDVTNEAQYADQLKSRFYEVLEEEIREHVQHNPQPIRHWTERDIQAAIRNVSVVSLEEWKGMVGDQWELVSDLV